MFFELPLQSTRSTLFVLSFVSVSIVIVPSALVDIVHTFVSKVPSKPGSTTKFVKPVTPLAATLIGVATKQEVTINKLKNIEMNLLDFIVSLLYI